MPSEQLLPQRLAELQKILAVRLDNIGDVIMLGPALRAMRRGAPEAQITLLASPAGTLAAPLLPWVDEVLTWRPAWQDISGALPFDPLREMHLIDILQGRGFEAAFIFTSFSQSPFPPAYACYLAGIPLRFGHSKDFGGQILSHCYEPPVDEVHQVDRNLSLVEKAGFEPDGHSLELAIPMAAQIAAHQLLGEVGIGAGQSYIALAPGASAAARRYPAGRFAEVARRLAIYSDLPVVILGSQRELRNIRPVLQALESGRVISLVGRTGVLEFAALIRGASLVVSNNSSALHLADAFRTPLVVLYSGTDYESQWEPRSSPARVLRIPTLCSPCYRFECPYHQECLDISPRAVVQVALEMLGRLSDAHAIPGADQNWLPARQTLGKEKS